MLSITDTGRPSLCDGLTRREILRAGTLGMLSGGLLPTAEAADSVMIPRGPAKRCLLLFLMGGPPQHSTWDPKPDAIPEVRGAYQPVSTSVPGTQICELLPRLAGMADKYALIRSVSHRNSNHTPVTCVQRRVDLAVLPGILAGR